MWRAQLRADFGIDLPISGGSGNSRSDPIVLELQCPDEASKIEMTVAKCIYGRLGMHWRSVAKSIVESTIQKHTFEVKFAEGDQIVTERRNFYFDLRNVALPEHNTTPLCLCDLPVTTDSKVPYEIGWLHFDQAIDNELTQQGLGLSVALSAPQTKVMIYRYGYGRNDLVYSDAPNIVHSEFEDATQDILKLTHGLKLVQDIEEPNFLFRSFVAENLFTLLVLGLYEGQFYKVRATIDGASDQYIYDCLFESIVIFKELLTSQPTATQS